MKKVFIYALSMFFLMSVTCTLSSCSDDDNEPDIPEQPSMPEEPGEDPQPDDDNETADDSRIYGTWLGFKNGTTYLLTFSDDGVMQEKTDNGTVSCHYTLKDGILDLHILSINRFQFVKEIGDSPFYLEFGPDSPPAWIEITGNNSSTITFFRQEEENPDTPDEPDTGGGENVNDLESQLIGEWYASTKRKSSKVHFLNNGEGYLHTMELFGDFGARYKAFSWSVRGSNVYLDYGGGKGKSLELQIEDDVMTGMTLDGMEQYSRVSHEGTTTQNYKKPSPYGSYLCWYGMYYPIEYVKRSCKHSTGYPNANVRYVNFESSSGETALYIQYYTPYYDGIDNYQPEGTFSVNTGSTMVHNYFAIAKINGGARDDIGTGKLKVKRNGKTVTYTYKNDDGSLELYFIGTEK